MANEQSLFVEKSEIPSVKIKCVFIENLPEFLENSTESTKNQVKTARFDAKTASVLIIFDKNGMIDQVLFGLGTLNELSKNQFTFANLLNVLPAGVYEFDENTFYIEHIIFALMLQSYKFERYKSTPSKQSVQFIKPENVNFEAINDKYEAISRGRTLINTPANDLGTEELANEVVQVGNKFGAETQVIKGTDLEENFPLIHAVGKASPRPPLLVDLKWRSNNITKSAPKITIIGKGVVFDTGGLDIKPSSAMLLMKKDMGGAATALALSELIMCAGLNVDLRLIIPSAENSIGGNAFRPNDIYRSRKGITIEIGDTDAEGRLILADALTLADEGSPDYIFNFATLTGAARVAMGPEIVPFFTDNDVFATQIYEAGVKVQDPLWRMPLWHGYETWLKGNVADLSSTGNKSGAGCIIAAIFLKQFVQNTKNFAHFDVFAWNPTTSFARPEGGEILAARAVFEVISEISKV